MIFWWRRCTEQSRSAQEQGLAVVVGKHLYFDVAWRAQSAFDDPGHRQMRRALPSVRSRARRRNARHHRPGAFRARHRLRRP